MKVLKVFLFCIIASVFVYTPIAKAATITHVLDAGKSIEIASSTSSYTITNTNKVDYASYPTLSGSSIKFEKDYSSSISVSSNYRVVITNPGTKSITLSSTSSAFIPVSTSTTALFNGTMLAGKNYEYISTYNTAFTIRNSSTASNLFDYVNYNEDGSISAYGRNSYSTTTTPITIPIKGKTVISVQNTNIDYWCAYDIYNNYVKAVERQAPALVKGSLEVGKNYKFASTYSKEIDINNDSSSTALFDYAKYSNDGVAVHASNFMSPTIKLPVKGKMVVSPISANINYWYPYDFYCTLITVIEVQDPALFKGTIQTDTTYEFASSYIENINITNDSSLSALYDYASYNSDGTIIFERGSSAAAIYVPINGKTVITATSGNLTYWMPYEFYTTYIVATKKQTPALFVGILGSQKNYKFTNNYIDDIILVNNNITIPGPYDVFYASNDNSGIFSNASIDSTFTIKQNGETFVTPLLGDITFWFPYDLYSSYITLIEKETPTLVVGTIPAAQTVEFINSSPFDLKIYNTGGDDNLYDYANYNSNGTMTATTYKNEAAVDNVIVPKKGKTVITALNKNLVYFYPYDLYNPYITINERINPALYKGIISLGKNMEYKSTSTKDIIITTDSRSAALKDTANYKFDDSVVFEHNSITTTTTVYYKGRTVISSLTGDVKYWLPYDAYEQYVAISEIQNPALFVGVLKSGKNYEFTNTNINKVDIANDSNNASLHDYVNYTNNDVLTFERSSTLKVTAVNLNGKTTVSSVHGDINYWYPYDIFKKYVTIVEKETPALSRCKLTQGNTYEFTNAIDNTITLKNDSSSSSSINYSYIKYNRDGSVAETKTSSSLTSVSLTIGQRIVVTCNQYSTREIEFYAPYGTFTNNGIFPNGDALLNYTEGFVIQNVTSLLTSPYSIKVTTNITYNPSMTDLLKLPKNATVVITLYKSDGTLYKTYSTVKQFAPNQMLKIENEFMSEEVLTNYSVKVLLLDSVSTIMPLAVSKGTMA